MWSAHRCSTTLTPSFPWAIVSTANPRNRHGCRDSLFFARLYFAGMVRSFISCCRATGYAQGGGKSREDADGNLKDGSPGFFLHGVRFFKVNEVFLELRS